MEQLALKDHKAMLVPLALKDHKAMLVPLALKVGIGVVPGQVVNIIMLMILSLIIAAFGFVLMTIMLILIQEL
jgi:hypothetical protein